MFLKYKYTKKREERRKAHSYRAFVHVVVILFFIVEINKGDP